MSEKGKNDEYRDKVKKADDGRPREHGYFGRVTNKEEKERKKK